MQQCDQVVSREGPPQVVRDRSCISGNLTQVVRHAQARSCKVWGIGCGHVLYIVECGGGGLEQLQCAHDSASSAAQLDVLK